MYECYFINLNFFVPLFFQSGGGIHEFSDSQFGMGYKYQIKYEFIWFYYN